MNKLTQRYRNKKRSDIGASLKALRKARGLIQVDLGKMLGLHQSAIARIELGEQEMSIAELCWVCSESDVTVLSFLNLEWNRPIPMDTDKTIGGEWT